MLTIFNSMTESEREQIINLMEVYLLGNMMFGTPLPPFENVIGEVVEMNMSKQEDVPVFTVTIDKLNWN